jgi:L-threonylcarbamoyladenylate synthase
MEIINSPTSDQIKKAAKALKDGHLVAFPTETVYGLGADATNGNAISRIYSVKGRPKDHPLIVHISSINQLGDWATDVPKYAIKLAQDFWPGPITLVLKRSKIAQDFITGNQDNVGLRVPNHPIAQILLREFLDLHGFGIAAPSANRFGKVSPTTSVAVTEEIGTRLNTTDLILDGGQCKIGIESTVVDCLGELPLIIRPGIISLEQIELSIGHTLNSIKSVSEAKAPGILESHYSPNAEITLQVNPRPGEGFIALAEFPTPLGVIRLSAPLTHEEFARDLYRALRLGDSLGLKKIAVKISNTSNFANAILDRLTKASFGNANKIFEFED